MARPQYTTEQLIVNIKQIGTIPTSQTLFLDTDFVNLATKQMNINVIPLIMSAREEYFVHYEDFVIQNSEPIDIPKESVGLKLRAAVYISNTNPLELVNMPRLTLEQVAGINYVTNVACGFYVLNNSLHFYPTNSVPNGYRVRLYFYDRPLVLADPLSYGQVEAIDEGTRTITLSRMPTTFEVGLELNSVSSEPGFQTTNRSFTIESVSAPDMVVSSVEGISVGDYISEIGTSAIPQLPIEAHDYLAQITAAKCLAALGDNDGAKEAFEEAKLMKENLLILINPRVDGSVKRVVNPSGGIKTFSGSRWRVW